MSWRISWTESQSSELGGHDLDALAVVQRLREVADAALVVRAPVVAVGPVAVDHPDRERGARQPGADRRRQVGAGRTVFELALGAVGKGHAHWAGMLVACGAEPCAPRADGR